MRMVRGTRLGRIQFDRRFVLSRLFFFTGLAEPCSCGRPWTGLFFRDSSGVGRRIGHDYVRRPGEHTEHQRDRFVARE